MEDYSEKLAFALQMEKEAEKVLLTTKAATACIIHECRLAGMTFREIAELMGVSYQTVCNKYYYYSGEVLNRLGKGN